MEVIDVIKEKLSIFKKLYDSIRIVDPIIKRVLEVQGDSTKIIEGNCYGIFKKEEQCRNCISMRAYLQNDTVVKMEFIDGKIMLITASPVTVDNKVYIVELVKIVSQAGSIFSNEKNSYTIQDLLNEMNDVAIADLK